MTRTAATTTEQNVVERQLAIESSLATTNNCNQLLLERKSQTLLHFCPVITTSIGALSLSLTLSVWVCVRVSGKLSVQWQQKELTAKQNRQRKRERKRVSKAAASNRCTSRK